MLTKLKKLAPSPRNTNFVAWESFERSDGTWLTESPVTPTRSTSRWALHRKREPTLRAIVEPSPCYIARLPEDIVLVIFHFLLQACTTDSRVARKQVRINFERIYAPFLLAAICRGWRLWAIATPTLWTYIGVRLLNVEPYASKPPPRKQERLAMEAICAHALDMIALLTERSGDAPLHVVMPIISTPLLFEDIQSFATSAVLMRRAIEILRAQLHMWQVWDICAMGGLSDLWRSLHAVSVDVTLEDGSHQNRLTLQLPALQALTIDHCMLGYGVDRPPNTMDGSPNLVLLVPQLQKAQTMIGDGMQVLCSSFIGPTLRNAVVPRLTVAPESLLTPAVQHLSIRSHTWGQRRFVLPLLRCLAPTLRVLEISLANDGAPAIPGLDGEDNSPNSFVDDSDDIRLDRQVQLPSLHELRWIVSDLTRYRLRSWASYLGIVTGSPDLRIVHLEFERYIPDQLHAITDALVGCQLTELRLSGALWANRDLCETFTHQTGATVIIIGA